MKYQPPFGSSDPNAGYINGNPASGVPGSIPPAGQMEIPQRELLALIGASLQTPTDADLTQVLQAVRGGQLTTFTDNSVSVNSIGIVPPAGAAYNSVFKGLPFRVFPAFTNTGTSVFVFVSALPSARLKKWDGSDPQPGDIVAGKPADMVYDGTYFLPAPLRLE